MEETASTPPSRLRRAAATLLLTLGYGVAILLATVIPRLRARPGKRNGRILVIGTFHNPNWFSAHIDPLSQCGCREVILVADGHIADLPGVRVIVPNPLVSRLISRALAKSLWAFYCALRYRPDLVMGYAIFPAATSALAVSRLIGRPSCFQLTSGELELRGGGFAAENRVLSSLGAPSAWVEKLAHKLTRSMDLVVVRGAEAAAYLRDIGYRHKVETITGSVVVPDERPGWGDRDVDLIFVGRVTERKRPMAFLETVELVKRDKPDVRVLMVGDGPDMEPVADRIEQLGLNDNVELTGLRSDVDMLLGRSRVFVLTSRWEGLSIAMLEAMTSGTVPVVNDVGDLRDVVDHGDNGFLVPTGEPEEFAARIAEALASESAWDGYSNKARARAIANSSRPAIAGKWNSALDEWVDVSGYEKEA